MRFYRPAIFHPELFEACIKSLLRPPNGQAGKTFVARLGLMLNHQEQSVEASDRSILFTETEYKILRAPMIQEDTSIILRTDILHQVFGSSTVSSRSLDVHVCTLRKKLRPLSLDIVSVRGVGYKVRTVAVSR